MSLVFAVQDTAAKKIARDLDFEAETWDMHDGDKVGSSAVGELVRKNGRGGIIYPFIAGEHLQSFTISVQNWGQFVNSLQLVYRIEVHLKSVYNWCLKFRSICKQFTIGI